MQITLKQIQYFLAAAETGQFSAAAAKVRVTQTAITAAIKELESLLGVRLFQRRHAAGVSLTLEGHRFLQHAHNIAAAVHAALHDPGLIQQNLQGKIRVGATHSILGSYIVPPLARFRKAYPQIVLEVVELPRPALERALLQGEIDVGVAWLANLQATNELATATIARSRRQLWLCANHSLLSKRVIGLSDIQHLPYVLYDQDETPENTLLFWQRFGLEPDIRYRVTSIEALRSLVAQGLAVTILSDVIYRPFSSEGKRIETQPLLEGLPPIEIGLVWPAGREQSPPVAAFTSFMRLTLAGEGTNGPQP